MKTPKGFWNQRYSTKDYAYGIEPNAFFKQEIQKLTPGRLLLPAEDEGRNAVFAVGQGWQATAFDISKEGKCKTELLAASQNVSVDYHLGSIDDMNFKKKYLTRLLLFLLTLLRINVKITIGEFWNGLNPEVF